MKKRRNKCKKKSKSVKRRRISLKNSEVRFTRVIRKLLRPNKKWWRKSTNSIILSL